MKKVIFFSLMLLALVACKKEENATDPQNPQVDPRDAFVGTYDLNLDGYIFLSTSNETIASMLPDSVSISQFVKTQTMTIAKDPDHSNQVIITGLYNCTALVSGNNLVLESTTESQNFNLGDLADLGIDLGSDIPVTYTFVHKMATLTDGVLTWHTDANASASVSVTIVIPITFDLTGVASIENTATKKAN